MGGQRARARTRTVEPILVANLGSTSFKFRLFDMPSERLLARGGMDRIGSPESAWSFFPGNGESQKGTATFADHTAAIRFTEGLLKDTVLPDFTALAAVGFKPVVARGISGTQYLDEPVLAAMEALNPIAPAHNPPYIAGVRAFRALYPDLPCIGTFETAFYDHLPERNRRFPVPLRWEREYGIRRTGFHGASHRFVTSRLAEIKGRDDLRVASCHLGGSSSIAAVKDGVAVDSSWGMTPQSGLPQNNRVGDLDPFAVLYVAETLGLGTAAVGKALASESGLKGMAGIQGGDMRDLLDAAASGNREAETAVEVFVGAIRKYLGAFLVELDGLDAIIFTAGIGENQPEIRAAVCAGMTFCGLRIDTEKNAATRGTETLISAPDSRIEVWVIPTNEEIVIAREAYTKLKRNKPPTIPTLCHNKHSE